MRNTVAFIVTLLFSVNTLAQDTTFVKFYGGAENETGADLMQVGNHFYLIGTYGSGGHGLTDLYVVKTDTFGNRIWTSALGTPAVEMATSGAAMGDTAVIIVGYTNSTFENTYDGLLTCIDSAGNELWSRTIGGPNWDMLHSVIVDTDGNIVAVGETSSSGAGGADGLLVKYDSHGNFLYQKTFGGPDEDRLKTLAQLTSTEYVLGGDFESGAIDSTDIVIIRTDLNGNALHTKYHGGVGQDQISKILISPSDEYWIVGSSTTESSGGFDFLLMHTLTDGTVAYYYLFGYAGDDRLYDAAFSSTGRIMVIGTSNSGFGSGMFDAYVYRFHDSGVFEHGTTFGGLQDEQGLSMVTPTFADAYIFSGHTNSFGCGNNDIYFVRMRNGGSYAGASLFSFCDTTGVISSVPESDRNFPVMVGSETGLLISWTAQPQFKVEIFDLTGRVLTTNSTRDGELNFSFQSHIPFIVKVTAKDGISFSKVFYQAQN
jgi:hypothetical protein